MSYCPHCGKELPASLLSGGSDRHFSRQPTFRVGPKLGWAVLFVFFGPVVVSQIVQSM